MAGQISSYGATGGHEWTLIFSLIRVVGSGNASLCSLQCASTIKTVTSRHCLRPGYNAFCTFGRDGALRSPRRHIAARCPYHKLDVRVAVVALDEVWRRVKPGRGCRPGCRRNRSSRRGCSRSRSRRRSGRSSCWCCGSDSCSRRCRCWSGSGRSVNRKQWSLLLG